jgi:hypothetical protein
LKSSQIFPEYLLNPYLMQPNAIAPPPWSLTGDCTVLVYHFPQKFNQEHGFLAGFQLNGYQGWIGAVMMVNYRTSKVGPYQELLFLPGLIKAGGKLSFSVSKIYVSTTDSAWNGVENWGLPKELADFTLLKYADGTRELAVYKDDKPIFEAFVKAWGPHFPVSSQLIPLSRLVQLRRGQLLQTEIVLSGRAQLSSVKSLSANPAYFPPVNRLKPLAALSIKDFHLAFPVPKII